MTLEEAQAIGRIASTADGGCSVCVESLAERLQKQFPQFEWTYPGAEWFDKSEEDIEFYGEDYEGWKYTGIDVSEPTQ